MKKLIIFLPIIFLCFNFFSCIDSCYYQTTVSIFCRYGDEKIENYRSDNIGFVEHIYLSETEDYPALEFKLKGVKIAVEKDKVNNMSCYYLMHFYEWDNIKTHGADLLNSSVLTISYYLSEDEVITLDSSAIKDWGEAPFYCTVDFLNQTFTLGIPSE